MIRLKNICKRYADKVIYDDFNLDIERGKITVILGESGSGKTTLMNILAGLTEYQGEVVGIDKRPAVVFQSDRLLKNLTVKENVKLVSPTLSDEEIERELDRVGLNGYAESYPKVLSGGMSRRVALSRALTFSSDTLLLDEPFSSLDLAWKIRLINRIKEGQKECPKTVFLITHDIKEALLIADRIIALEGGKILCDIRDIDDKTEEKLFKLMAKID